MAPRYPGYDSTAARRTPQFVKSAPYSVVYPGPSASIFKLAQKRRGSSVAPATLNLSSSKSHQNVHPQQAARTKTFNPSRQSIDRTL
jgi:hypothetical protein